MSAPQPWECPRCHRMNAPFAEQCKCTELNVTATVTVTPPAVPPERIARVVEAAIRNGSGGPRAKPRPYKMKRQAYNTALAIQKLLAQYGEAMPLCEIAEFLWKECGYTSQRSAYSGMYQILADHGSLIGAVRVSGDLVTYDLRYNQRKASAKTAEPGAPETAHTDPEEE